MREKHPNGRAETALSGGRFFLDHFVQTAVSVSPRGLGGFW